MTIKKLLLTCALLLSVCFAFSAVVSCVREVESDTQSEPVSEPVSESMSDSDSEPISESESESEIIECGDVHTYYQGATGRLYDIDVTVVYNKAELAQYFGSDLSGLTFFGNEEIDCLHNGHALFICDNCGEAVLLEISGEHNYVYNEENAEIDKEGATLPYVCAVCGDEQEAIVTNFNAVTVPSTCSFEGYIYVNYNFVDPNGELGRVDNFIVENLPLDNNVHKFNGNKLLLDETYRESALKEVFGEELNGLNVLANFYNCVVEGSGTFTCADCEELLGLKILRDHDYKLSEQDSIITEEEIHIEFKCSMCGDLQPAEFISRNIREVISSCKIVGGTYLEYTYSFNGKTYSDSKILHQDSEVNPIIHRANGKYLSERNPYRMWEIEEIFGEELYGIEFLANTRNCVQEGYAVFTCSDCKGQIAIQVYGNHEYDFKEEGSCFDEGEISLLFVCRFCHEEDNIPADNYRYFEVPATCNKTGGRFIEYTYRLNGETHTDTALVDLYAIEPHVHDVNGCLLDDRDAIAATMLSLAFGNDLNGLTVLKDYIDCTEDGYGYAAFLCENCNQSILLTTRADHTFVLNEEESVYGDELVVLKFVCSVCGEEFTVETVPTVTRHHSAVLSEVESIYVIYYNVRIDYAYVLDGTRYTDSKYWEDQPLNFNMHEYKGRIVDQTKEYTYQELREIFGDNLKDLRFYENDANYVSFICEECGMEILLRVVY